MRSQIAKLAVALSLISVFVPATAVGEVDRQPEPDAAEILERVDSELTAVEDMRASASLTIHDTSGSESERTLTVKQKGDDRRMVQITAPARLQDVGLLATSDDRNYLYLPAMRRVRRIAGADRGEPFLDSDFTNDDLMRTTFADRYTPRLENEDSSQWSLVLTPIDEDDEPYSRLRMKVRKEDHQIAEILFYKDGDDDPTRRLTADQFDPVESQIIAHRFVAEDLQSEGRSVLQLSEVEVNVGLDDSEFTRRQLQR